MTRLKLALIPLLTTSLLTEPAAPPEGRWEFPAQYRQHFTRYAVIDRPDGIVRFAYASPDAVLGVHRRGELPIGAVLLISGFLKDGL